MKVPALSCITNWSVPVVAALIVACTGTANAPPPAADAAGTANEAIARRHIEEAWNAGNVAVFDETVSPTHVGYTNGVQDSLSTPEGMKRDVAGLRTTYPDAHLQIDEMFSVGDKVVMRFTFHGTNAQVQKPLTLPGAWIGRFENSKLVEDWTYFDNAAAVTQLGGQVIPPTPPTPAK
jgi:predicted ester cyclase